MDECTVLAKYDLTLHYIKREKKMIYSEYTCSRLNGNLVLVLVLILDGNSEISAYVIVISVI